MIGRLRALHRRAAPAAEFVRERLGDEAIEFAAWKPSDASPARVLYIDGHSVRFHLFDETWYRKALHDPTDYNPRTRRR